MLQVLRKANKQALGPKANKQQKEPQGQPLKGTFQYLNRCATNPITAQIKSVKKCVKCFDSSI